MVASYQDFYGRVRKRVVRIDQVQVPCAVECAYIVGNGRVRRVYVRTLEGRDSYSGFSPYSLDGELRETS
jgi:hypothetical protein